MYYNGAQPALVESAREATWVIVLQTDLAPSQQAVVASIEQYLASARTDSPNWPVT